MLPEANAGSRKAGGRHNPPDRPHDQPERALTGSRCVARNNAAKEPNQRTSWMNSESCSNGAMAPTDWNAVDWRRANTMVRNLRQRIYRATVEGDLRKVRSLQKLMLRSYANNLVSVGRVSQQNAGAKTPGVDHVLVKTPEARGRLVDALRTGHRIRALPVRRIYTSRGQE